MHNASSQDPLTAHDATDRLARFLLFPSTETGAQLAVIKAKLLAAQVPADYPFAIGEMLRRPKGCACSIVHVGISRLPCGYGLRA